MFWENFSQTFILPVILVKTLVFNNPSGSHEALWEKEKLNPVCWQDLETQFLGSFTRGSGEMTGEVVPLTLTPFLSFLLISSVYGDLLNHARYGCDGVRIKGL